jgi:hypothetical protein
MSRRIAWFISPHGFGHAARSCAVMAALLDIEPHVEFDIYTSVPDWFFNETLGDKYRYHRLVTDIGLAQHGPFETDLPATITLLSEFIPFRPALLETLSAELHASGATQVVCDISPLGIAAAHKAGIPNVLIENFTWDWIYSAYLEVEPGLASSIQYLAEIFELAGERIQTAPECLPLPQTGPVLPPASRKPRTPREETRRSLGIGADEALILVSSGGIPMPANVLEALEEPGEINLIMPVDIPEAKRRGRLIFLPHHSPYYHPDLIAACDGVVGKAGYSTVAEVLAAGRPFGYLARADFPETPCLVEFIHQNIPGFEIPLPDFESGAWVARLPALLALAPSAKPAENGARRIAERVLGADRR